MQGRSSGSLQGPHHHAAHQSEATKPQADPTPLALAGFSAIVMMVSAHYAGLVDSLDFISSLGMLAGVTLLLGSAYNFRVGHNLPASNFAVFGAFWLSIAIHALLLPSADLENIMTFLRIPIAIYTSYAWVASFYVSKASLFVMTTLELKLLFFIVGQVKEDGTIMKVGGCFGIACAAAGFYTSASLLMKPRFALPLGAPLLVQQSPVKDPSHTKRGNSLSSSKRWLMWFKDHEQAVLEPMPAQPAAARLAPGWSKVAP